MTSTDEFQKLLRKEIEPAARVIRQNKLDSYDEKLNPAIRPIKESTFKVKRPFRVTKTS